MIARDKNVYDARAAEMKDLVLESHENESSRVLTQFTRTGLIKETYAITVSQCHRSILEGKDIISRPSNQLTNAIETDKRCCLSKNFFLPARYETQC